MHPARPVGLRLSGLLQAVVLVAGLELRAERAMKGPGWQFACEELGQCSVCIPHDGIVIDTMVDEILGQCSVCTPHDGIVFDTMEGDGDENGNDDDFGDDDDGDDDDDDDDLSRR
ncbi:hypothetical protein PoB_006060100 [Plakobranchus ocellatus]|uniref:Uncharacterized protein n=1 Tax=Plakobranchus ocellatus TaxID=259542 RepID=A0AAV4CQM0_9GAST|nr:hypothetical protein PoB_006060100 [Plakobranchus ocellatus]